MSQKKGSEDETARRGGEVDDIIRDARESVRGSVKERLVREYLAGEALLPAFTADLIRNYFLVIKDELGGPHDFYESVGKLFGVTADECRGWESGEIMISEDILNRVIRFSAVLVVIGDMIKREDKLAFFAQQHPLLQYERPIDLLATIPGMQRITQLIEGIETGSFS